MTLIFLGLFLFLVSFVCADGGSSSEVSISQATLLLPPNRASKPVFYELEGYNGCFIWTSSNSAVAMVKPVESSIDEEGDCSTKAIVTPTANLAGRRAAWITAEDRLSGRKIQCEVFVDFIARVQIETTTRVMYKGEKEALEILAFDKHGNKFSSVTGLSFLWTILATEQQADTHAVLKLVPFSGSSYEVDTRVRSIEAGGQQSHIVLIEGVGTGRARVFARLVDELTGRSDATSEGAASGAGTASNDGESAGEAPTADVLLSVIELLELVPRYAVYVTPGTSLPYGLKRMQRSQAAGDSHDDDDMLTMPDPQYAWSTSNSSVAKIDGSGMLTAGSTLGEAEVKVAYARMQENYYTGMVYVVEPARLVLRVVPCPNGKRVDATDATSAAEALHTSSGSTYLATNRVYCVDALAHDDAQHTLHERSIDAMKYNLVFDESHFEVLSRSRNGGHAVVRARDVETASLVTATLDRATDVPLEVRQPVQITAPVKILDGDVVLPWDGRTKQQTLLHPSGGSGEYEWRSVNPAVATVNEKGRLIVHAPGRTRVTLVDKLNPLNTHTVDVSTLAVSARAVEAHMDRLKSQPNAPADAVLAALSAEELASLPALRAQAPVTEVQVGDTLDVDALLSSRAGTLFTNCTALPLAWQTRDVSVFAFDDDDTVPTKDSKGVCSHRRLRALKAGRTTITVGSDDHSAEVEVFAYEPLRLVSPRGAQATLVTFGATGTLEFAGGPHGWYADVKADLEAEQPSKVAIERVLDANEKRVYRVTCLALHDQTLTLRVSKQATPRNPQPPVIKLPVEFHCRSPHSLYIYPPNEQAASASKAAALDANAPAATDEAGAGIAVPSPRWFDASLASASNTGGENSAHVVPTSYQLRNNRSIAFNAALLDYEGRLFHNASTINYEWYSSNPALAAFAGALPTSRTLTLGDAEGDLHVGVKALAYDQASLSAAGAHQTPPPLPLDDKRRDEAVLHRDYTLSLVRNLYVTPEFSVLLNRPNNSVVLTAAGGSGEYRFVDKPTGTSQHQSVIRLEPVRADGTSVRAQPLRVGQARVLVRDLALEGADAVESVIRVSDVGGIRIKAPAALKTATSRGVGVTLLDDRGEPFSAEQQNLATIDGRVDGTALKLHRVLPGEPGYAAVKDSDGTVMPLQYVIDGEHPGSATLSFSSDSVHSAPHAVDVFAPVHLDAPEKLTLLPGTSYQLAHRGGPPGADVRYEIDDGSIVSLDGDVLTGLARRDGKPGTTRVRAVVYERDPVTGEEVVAEEHAVDIEVLPASQAAQHMRIVAPATRLLEGNELTWHVAAGDATPHAFGALPDAKFRWHSASPDIANVAAVHGAAGVSVDREAAFAARVVGRAPGTARISVSTTAFGGERAVVSRNIEVLERLRLKAPPVMLLPPGAQVPLTTNKDGRASLTYTLCCGDSDVLALDSEGRVTAGSRSGTAGVMVCDQDDGQCVVQTITVRPVHHIQVLPMSESSDATAASDDGNVLYEVPVGATQNYQVALRDELGEVFFDYAKWKFAFDSNAPDVAALALGPNGTLSVRGQMPGLAVARVYATGAPHMQDFIRLRVATVIRPIEPAVHVGGSVQFSLLSTKSSSASSSATSGNNATTTDDAGAWTVEDPRVASIDGVTGVLTARSVGQTTVYHKSSVHSYTTVTVVAAASVVIDASEAAFVSNARSSDSGLVETYSLPVSFADSARRSLADSDVVRNRLRLSCAVEPAAWADARAVRDDETGAYMCELRPLPLSTSELRRTKPIGAIDVVATVTDVNGRNSVSARKSLPFIAAFVIVNRPDETDDGFLRLHRGRTTAFLEVYGAKAASLIVKTSNAALLSAKSLRSQTADSSFTTLYEIAVLRPREPFSDVTVEFVNYATGQSDAVHVSYSLADPAETAAKSALDAASALPLLPGEPTGATYGERLYRRAVDPSTGLPIAVDVTEIQERRANPPASTGGFWSSITIAIAALLAAVLAIILMLCVWIMCGHWLRRILRATSRPRSRTSSASTGTGTSSSGAPGASGSNVFVPVSPYAPSNFASNPDAAFVPRSASQDPVSPNFYRSPLRPRPYHASGVTPRDASAPFSPALSPFVSSVRRRAPRK